MKYLIFDAGPIISLTMNGLLPVLEKLREVFDGEFILTPQVKREVIDRPLKIKKYELEGLMVQNLLDRGILTPSSKVVSNQALEHETAKVMRDSNQIFSGDDGEHIKIIHDGEASCLAFHNLCKCESMIVADERTIRMIFEAPLRIKELMERKLHMPLAFHKEALANLGGYKFIRSSELLFVAYKKDLIGLKKNKILLEALMHGVKSKGAAISSKEISDLKSLA